MVTATVEIARPVTDVFSFYRDFHNLPSFLGDVMSVDIIDRARSRWTIQGPFGLRTHPVIRVTSERANSVLRYETVASRLLQGRWELSFTAGAAVTTVTETMHVPFGIVGRCALTAVGKSPTREVRANLHRLKELLESGTVADTRHSVRGKFRRR
jgi:uncharacterized membrane protein